LNARKSRAAKPLSTDHSTRIDYDVVIADPAWKPFRRSSAETQGPPPQVALDESALAKRARGKLKFLYRIRMTYPQGWRVNVAGDKGTEAYHCYLAEGTVEGRINLVEVRPRDP
jgi:hypothetical protein